MRIAFADNVPIMIKLIRWMDPIVCGLTALLLGWAFFPEAVIFFAGFSVVVIVVTLWQASRH